MTEDRAVKAKAGNQAEAEENLQGRQQDKQWQAGDKEDKAGQKQQLLKDLNVEAILPHRYPFLLVDRILEVEPGRRAVGIKNVTRNEYFFEGHFPGHPVMPGVLMVEALAQVGAVALLTMEENRGKIPLFTGIEKLRFKRQVVPGDTLRLEMEVLKIRGPMGRGQGTVTVEGEVAVRGELLFFLAPAANPA